MRDAFGTVKVGDDPSNHPSVPSQLYCKEAVHPINPPAVGLAHIFNSLCGQHPLHMLCSRIAFQECPNADPFYVSKNYVCHASDFTLILNINTT